ncbi:MAG: DUF4469 domain-containing protein [Phycisphaerae bacterium]|nr:DUF4469 domain-containing protein [Phycisphaerae bacterium]
MPIHYALFENNVTADPDDYAASVQMTDTADLDTLIRRMIERGSTTTRADILAVMEDAIGACESMLLDGMRVNFGGLVELFPRVRGIFNGATDTFDPARHSVDVGANPGSRVRQTVRDTASVVKDEAVKPSPNPLEYRDVGSDTTNDQVTPGNIGQLSGSRLKYDATQADEGIYFVATAGGETKVATVQKNKPSQLVFLVPAGLLAGTYYVEVRARIRGGTDLRIGRLDSVLTV